MPFTDQLQQWAQRRPEHPAVIVGGRTLNYAQLSAVCTPPAAAGLGVIDTPDGADLALALCAAISGEGTAAVLDAGWPAALKDSVREAAGAWAATHIQPAQGRAGSEETTFLLGFSSGTSGIPKAFTRSRVSWRSSIAASIDYFGLQPSDVTLVPGPPSASMNLYALAECLASGSTFVGLAGFSARSALAAIEKYGVTRLVVVPSVLKLMADAGLAAERCSRGLRSIVCAGSALSGETLHAARAWAPNATIHQYYGAAELGFIAAMEAAPGQGATTVGQPFPGVEIRIIGGDGQDMPAGRIGSIYVRSPYVSDGYAWGEDHLAFGALDSGAGGSRETNWHTVRDQGFLDENGALMVMGRASEMMLVAGNNVYPQEIETVLSAGNPHLVVLAGGLTDAHRGQRIVVGVFSASLPQKNAVDALRAQARTLPAAHRPGAYYVLTQMPETAAGKPSRVMLLDWIERGDPRAQRIQ
ncbi:AMP-binding protein [Arthrobacter sp. LAPM80]|uniref:class I adenylate-forming enzyme family protein n=1 Tax=Arthrobacter sp. LAPM80 TaxID=3141788 RepID=UPI00398A9EAC